MRRNTELGPTILSKKCNIKQGVGYLRFLLYLNLDENVDWREG